MAKTLSARRHRQGPKAARMRGRSEATSLARCRAQIQHRGRDGRRIRRGAARCSDACPKACNDRDYRGRRIKTCHRALNECDFVTRISLTNGTRSSGRAGVVADRVPLVVRAHLDLRDLPHPRLWQETVVEVECRCLLPLVEVRRPCSRAERLAKVLMVGTCEPQRLQEIEQCLPVARFWHRRCRCNSPKDTVGRWRIQSAW